MNLRPLRDRVLLELLPDEKKSAGGIMLPDGDKKYIRKARVLKVARDAKQPLTEGQVVFAVWNCGNPVGLYDGQGIDGATNECRLLKTEDVWAVENNPPPKHRK